MCTMIAHRVPMAGSGKGPGGWFDLDHVYVGYDHPFHVALDHALTIDFVNEGAGSGARTAVELDLGSARQLAEQILAAVDEAEAYEAGPAPPGTRGTGSRPDLKDRSGRPG